MLDVVNQLGTPSERFLSRKIDAVARCGVDVCVLEVRPTRRAPRSMRVTAGGRWGQLRAAFKLAGSRPRRFLGLVARSARSYGPTLRTARAIGRAALLVEEAPDIVHFSYSGIGVEFLDAVRIVPDVRVVVSCRGSAELIRPVVDAGRLPRLRLLFDRADAIHCVSAAMAAHVQSLGAPDEKTHVVRPAVDVRAPRPVRQHRGGPSVVVSVGRLSWEKGLDDGIAAVARLRERGLDVMYRIVGAGGDRERLHFLADRCGLSEYVEFLGQQSEAAVGHVLATAHVLMLPSISEGISNAVLEAMAAGVPVVSTDVGGMREVVVDGVTGLLVQPREPAQLADALQRLLEEPDLAEKVSTEATRLVAERHALDDQGAAFVALYRQVTTRGEHDQVAR